MVKTVFSTVTSKESEGSYHKHLVKIFLELINIGICLQALSISHHAAQHELIVLLHQKTTFKNLLTLTHQLQSANNTDISTSIWPTCKLLSSNIVQGNKMGNSIII